MKDHWTKYLALVYFFWFIPLTIIYFVLDVIFAIASI